METLSTKPEYVTGGDVLVSVAGTAATLHATLNGADVTAMFKANPSSAGTMIGLVTGLTVGANTFTADNGGSVSTLALTDYSLDGPIFSGPQIKPFICQTAAFKLPDGTAFGTAATDATPTCSAPTVIQYMYMQKTGTALVPLANPAAVPADAATTTNTNGTTVNFIVRVETGTMDRGIYQNVVLFDPTSDAAPTPLTPPKGWNKKLIAIHGVGCTGGWYIQGSAMGVSPTADPTVLQRLSEGYGIFVNTLNHPTNSCNAIVAGEVTMMGKEHFIEEFGVPTWTASIGTSGGSYTSEQVADIYPGLIDGIYINAVFPDALAIAMSGLDDKLLNHFYTTANDVAAFTEDQMTAVSGHLVARAWYDLAEESGRTDPISGRMDTIPASPLLGPYAPAVFNPVVPMSLEYNPTTNPTGARATVFDVARAVYGVDAMSRGLRPYDNIGVQYGLAQLNAGTITSTQFLELNEKIGGYDGDGNYTTAREIGDPGAIQRAFQSGLNLGTSGGLSQIPIFDSSYLFDDTEYYHYQVFHFAARDRLLRANGDTSNHVMWRGGINFGDLFSGMPDPGRAAIVATVAVQGWALFVQWMDAYKSDTSSMTQRQKVIADKPAGAVDGCFTPTVPPVFQAETQVLASSGAAGSCNAMWPSGSLPRIQAGGPIASDTLKCQLKPIATSDYTITFTSDEMTRLGTIFPNGVCDYTQPSADRMPLVTYGSFGPSTVNPVYTLP